MGGPGTALYPERYRKLREIVADTMEDFSSGKKGTVFFYTREGCSMVAGTVGKKMLREMHPCTVVDFINAANLIEKGYNEPLPISIGEVAEAMQRAYEKDFSNGWSLSERPGEGAYEKGMYDGWKQYRKKQEV